MWGISRKQETFWSKLMSTENNVREPMNTINKTKVKKKLDVIFSKVIRARDKKCLKCGKRENLQCAHVSSRTHLAGRWNEMNAITLCTGCHLYWAHKEPVEFSEWLKTTHPAVWEESRMIRATLWQPTLQDYQDLLEELTARLTVLERRR